MLPYAEDLDAEKIHVQVPTHVIFLCGGPISNISETPPLSLRDAFYKILDNPVLKKRELILAEEITARIAAFDKYKNILELETDLAQIVELIILFCESEGSLDHYLHGRLALTEQAQLAGMLAFVNGVEPEFLERLQEKYGTNFLQQLKSVRLPSRQT